MDMSELIDEYFSLKGPRSGIMEGAVGLRNMEKIVEIFGYRQGIRNFLQENSGALESILEWIREQDVEDWKEQLREELDKFATGE
jgi:DNA/RNA-binding domain of Phe-tRNA-synthetase-like protein